MASLPVPLATHRSKINPTSIIPAVLYVEQVLEPSGLPWISALTPAHPLEEVKLLLFGSCVLACAGCRIWGSCLGWLGPGITR